MTTQAAIPLKWYVPFATGDASRVEIPVTSSDATRASQTLGFPPLTMQPPAVGGVPPQGEDFNGAMNQVARVAWWVLNGGGWPYDATFATNSNIGGYPNGAVLQSADFLGQWISTADNNQNNPDTSGTNWVPGFQYGATALTGQTGGTVTLTPLQAAKRGITISGTLTSALVVNFPTWVKDWSITNNTTGSFTVIAKTAAGSGITIPQNGSPTPVSGDGTNINQFPQNIAAGTSGTHAATFAQTTGRLLNVQFFSGNGTYTPTAGTNSIIVEGVGGGGGGGGCPSTTAGQQATAQGGISGTWGRVRFTSGFTGGLAVTIGTFGAGGATGSNNGGNGTSTTLGSIVAFQGGAGGAGGTASATSSGVAVNTGNSNSPTIVGGTLLAFVSGRSGPGSIITGTATATIVSGTGGDSPEGRGGIAASGTPGNAATGYGGGGGGCSQIAGSAGSPGGNGGNGCLRIYEYA